MSSGTNPSKNTYFTYCRHHFNLCATLNWLSLGLQFLYIVVITQSNFHTLTLPLAVSLEVIAEAVLQVILYLLLIIIQLAWGWGIAQRYPTTSTQIPLRQLGIFILCTFFIFTSNGIFFPASRFSLLFLQVIPAKALPPLFVFLSTCGIALTLNTLYYLLFKGHYASGNPLRRFDCINRQTRQKITGALLLLTSITCVLFQFGYEKTMPFPEHASPNIILIGIDSLSPERINAKDTPALAQFLQESVRFTDTISPLARTFPAWSSILTGLYPLHHQARENLHPSQLVKSDASIVWKFRQLGYSTIFGSDDRRFNNLDKEFGFQTIIGPKIGINDFILGGFYDFPLSNLLINTPIGHWLFPYHHMNRASDYVYYPKTFNRAIDNALNQSNPEKPLFLAIHFTLPHWPYVWAKSRENPLKDAFDIPAGRADYYSAVQAVDKQFAFLLTRLKQHNLLANSLIFVLSDHGEALYEKGSRITTLQNYQGKHPSTLARYFKNNYVTPLDKSGGHGSDLLSPSQFHCVLGAKIFLHQKQITSAKIIPTRVALIDIAPTIYAFMPSISSPTPFDGISLLSALVGKSVIAERPLLLESGLLPNQHLSMKAAIYYAKRLYHVNPSTHRFELKRSKLNAVNAMKLYGIINKDWLLVLYPDKNHYLTVLVQLSTQQWTDDPHSRFAKQAPMHFLLKKLLTFYTTDLGNYPHTRYTKLRVKNHIQH